MRHFMIAAVAAACLFGAGSAHAQYYRHDYGWAPWNSRFVDRGIDCDVVYDIPAFRVMDRNYDGRISRWEFSRQGLSLNDFRILDRNGDGVVSRREINAARRNCD